MSIRHKAAYLSCLVVSVACGSVDEDQWVNEPVGTNTEELRKGTAGAVNGDTDYCNGPTLCTAGEGDCDLNTHCAAGLVCGRDNGPKFGFPAIWDICWAPTCLNGVQDGDETGTDCGGSCGPCAPQNVSAARYGGTADDFGMSTAVDASGNIIVAGRFRETANFGGANLTRAGASPTASDVFVAKYTSGGAHIWSQRFGGDFADGDNDVGVAVDTAGNVFVTGNFYLTVNFGGGALTSAGSADIFVLKLDPNGAHLWSQRFGGAGVDTGTDIAVDRSNNVVVSSTFEQSMTFGGAALTSAGGRDIGVAKLNGVTGAHLWSRRFGSTGLDTAEGIFTDYDRHVHVVGSFSGTVPFGTVSLVSAGLTDGFMVRLHTTTGAPLARRGFGGVSNDLALGIFTDNQRRPVVTGYFKRTTDFGGGPVVAAGATDRTDAFIAAYNADYSFRWARAFGGPDHDQGLDITGNPTTGDVAITGIMRGTVPNFLPGGVSATSNGGADVFVARLAALNGSIVSASHYGGTGDDVSESIVFAAGNVNFTGFFNGTATFGATPLTSAGGTDVFRARFPF